jgi:hypothetical protein
MAHRELLLVLALSALASTAFLTGAGCHERAVVDAA